MGYELQYLDQPQQGTEPWPGPGKPVGEHWGGYYSSILKVGSPVGLFYGQVYEGVLTQQDIDAGNLSARPGDPKFKNIPDDPNNSTVIGNANPDFFGGLGTTVTYKGISLNAFFQYSVGNDVMNLNSAYFLPGNANVNCYRELAEKMWTPEIRIQTLHVLETVTSTPSIHVS